MTLFSSADEIREAVLLMSSFAKRTGLTSDAPERRYLWTDAFAVCNYIGLTQATGDARFTSLARRLVDRVHHVLGRHRDDEERSGWISGLSEAQGEAHPTKGGLRIGKPLAERSATERFDQNLEWQRDGQYFHYLTKWMHALGQVYRWAREPAFDLWARELAQVAHDAFVVLDEAGPKMVWKMSVDLSRQLVPSMGHHDPLDGFITCVELQTTMPEVTAGPDLANEAAHYEAMALGRSWDTTDPLGTGGLLVDASRVAQLMELGAFQGGVAFFQALLSSASRGLYAFATEDPLRRPVSQRLAFREIGLAIGLRAIELIASPQDIEPRQVARTQTLLEDLSSYSALGSEITSFWRKRENQRAHVWAEHRDINDVMLATYLVPNGFLCIGSRNS